MSGSRNANGGSTMTGRRARAILRELRDRSLTEPVLEEIMTKDEAADVKKRQRDMPGWASFYDALCDIAKQKE